MNSIPRIPFQVRRPRPLDDREISDREVDTWLAALAHLNAEGLHGLVPDDVRANDRFRYLTARATS